MAVTHIQDTGLGSALAVTSQATPNFGSTPSQGNAVLVWAWGIAGSTIAAGNVTCTDVTGANTYTQYAFKVFAQSSTKNLWCAVFLATGISTQANFNATVSSTVNTSIMVGASEFSGVASGGQPAQAAVSSSGISGSPAPGVIVNIHGDLLAAVMCNANTSSSATVTTPGGWTASVTQTDGTGGTVGQGIYKITNITGGSNVTWNSGSVAWVASQVEFSPGLGFRPFWARRHMNLRVGPPAVDERTRV